MSTWMKKKVKPKSSAVSSANNLLLCNYSPSFDHFKGANQKKKKKKKKLLELKESLNEK